MPYHKRKFVKKPYKRRRAKPRAKSLPYSTNFGLPQKKRCIMTFVQPTAFTTTSGVMQAYRFRANGLYDPNLTGGGGQCYGMSQMSALYNNYVVHGASATVKFYNEGTQTSNVVVGLELSKSAILPFNDYKNFIEKNKGKRYFVLQTNSRDHCTLSAKATTKAVWQVKDLHDDDELTAQFTADPIKEWYITLWSQAQDYTSTRTCQAIVTINYDVEWFNPKEVAAS